MNDSAVLSALQTQVAQLAQENGELKAMVYEGVNESLAKKLRIAEKKLAKAEAELEHLKGNHILVFGA